MKTRKLLIFLASSVAALALVAIVSTFFLLTNQGDKSASGSKDQTTSSVTNDDDRSIDIVNEADANPDDKGKLAIYAGGADDLMGEDLPDTANNYTSQYFIIKNQIIHYTVAGTRTGQAVINKNPKTEAATWGGVTAQSCVDNKNTHFIAHNPGAFNVLTQLKNNDMITVVDSAKKKRNYRVRVITRVDDKAYEIGTKRDYWSIITGTGGGERITLQTCLSRTTNLIVIAY
ncbi:Sortase family protein [Pilibacter termitis]|uniref:Sortase family protein n=1 Tax=Pilibacter termitis TaxID=263852 RepID=A0A1T4KAP5_9ENTE|nr:sortase [Pilibacter termitis]SJZ39538.1 Sortase family protein [Pilibacter termitis]